MTPYYESDGVTIYHGDCLEVLPTINARIIIADPPYSSGGFQESGKTAGSIGTRADDEIPLDNLSTYAFRAFIKQLCQSTTADEFFIFTDWKMWPWLLEAAELGGVKTRNMIVWDKQQMGMGMPWRNQHELIYYGKRTPGQINTGKFGNVIGCQRAGNVLHPTEKPVNLIKTLIANTGPGLICDPVMGSGTTLCAAMDCGRQCVGVEINQTFCRVAADRLARRERPLTQTAFA